MNTYSIGLRGLVAIGAGTLLAAAAQADDGYTMEEQSRTTYTEGGSDYDSYPHTYIGGAFGYFSLENEGSTSSSDFKDESASWKGYVGTSLNQIFSVEAGYTDFGEVSHEGTHFDADGIPLSLMAALPLSPAFAPYAKVGQLFWDADGRGGTEAGQENFDGDDTFYGVGARMDLSQALGLRLEYERLALDEADVDMATAGLAFKF